MTTNTTYAVQGMTCGHCVSAVTEEISKLPGVTAVEIDLRPNDVSLVAVTSESPLDEHAVDAAVDEAGYQLASS